MTGDKPDRLLVIWTSGEKEVATNMAFMYALNSKLNNWWDGVTLLIWGASGKLLAEDRELQNHIAALKEADVEIIACKKCAENQGIVEKLKQMLGVQVEKVEGQGEQLLVYVSKGQATKAICSGGSVVRSAELVLNKKLAIKEL